MQRSIALVALLLPPAVEGSALPAGCAAQYRQQSDTFARNSLGMWWTGRLPGQVIFLGDSVWARPQRDKQIDKISTYTDYELRFELRFLGVTDEWSNIVHFTLGENADVPGSRIPAIFVRPGRTNLHIVTGTDNAAKHSVDTEDIPLRQETSVRIVVEGGELSVFFNDILELNSTLGPRSAYSGVRVFLADDFYSASQVEVRNMRYGPPRMGQDLRSTSVPEGFMMISTARREMEEPAGKCLAQERRFFETVLDFSSYFLRYTQELRNVRDVLTKHFRSLPTALFAGLCVPTACDAGSVLSEVWPLYTRHYFSVDLPMPVANQDIFSREATELPLVPPGAAPALEPPLAFQRRGENSAAVVPESGTEGCWSGGFTRDMCCDTSYGPRGHAACWDSAHSFERCCGGGAGASARLASMLSPSMQPLSLLAIGKAEDRAPHSENGTAWLLEASGSNKSAGGSAVFGEGSCWSEGFTAEMCCDLNVSPQGRISCWDGTFTFASCCGQPSSTSERTDSPPPPIEPRVAQEARVSPATSVPMPISDMMGPSTPEWLRKLEASSPAMLYASGGAGLVLLALLVISWIRRCCSPRNSDEFYGFSRDSPRVVTDKNAECFSIATPRDSPRRDDVPKDLLDEMKHRLGDALRAPNMPNVKEEQSEEQEEFDVVPGRGDVGGTSSEEGSTPEPKGATREEMMSECKSSSRMAAAPESFNKHENGAPPQATSLNAAQRVQLKRTPQKGEATDVPVATPRTSDGVTPTPRGIAVSGRSGKVAREVQMLEAARSEAGRPGSGGSDCEQMRAKMEARRRRLEGTPDAGSNLEATGQGSQDANTASMLQAPKPAASAAGGETQAPGRVTGPFIL